MVDYEDKNIEQILEDYSQLIQAIFERKKVAVKVKKQKEKKIKLSFTEEKDYMMSWTIGKIDKELRPVFSLAIRLAWAWEENGQYYNTCYTTKQVFLVSELQAGHWIGRTCKTWKYHVDNVKPQCYTANMKHMGNGMSLEFEKYLKEEGIDTSYMVDNKNNKILQEVYYSREYLVNLFFQCKDFTKSTWFSKKNP